MKCHNKRAADFIGVEVNGTGRVAPSLNGRYKFVSRTLHRIISAGGLGRGEVFRIVFLGYGVFSFSAQHDFDFRRMAFPSQKILHNAIVEIAVANRRLHSQSPKRADLECMTGYSEVMEHGTGNWRLGTTRNVIFDKGISRQQLWVERRFWRRDRRV